MKNEREKTDVVVKVLDFSELETQAAEKFAEAHPEHKNVTAKIHHKWAYVETPSGTYVVCDEGVMNVKPVSKEHPVVLDVCVEYDGESGGRAFPMFPAYTMNLTDEFIPEIPVSGEVNLADFIRSFGSRLESNYYECNEALTKELGLVTA